MFQGTRQISRSASVRAAAVASLMAVVLAGCSVHTGPHHRYPSGPHYQHQPQAVHIPPGHMPPPGQCRIWYPDRPPGHQGPVGKCRKLERRVPQGAVLVRG